MGLREEVAGIEEARRRNRIVLSGEFSTRAHLYHRVVRPPLFIAAGAGVLLLGVFIAWYVGVFSSEHVEETRAIDVTQEDGTITSEMVSNEGVFTMTGGDVVAVKIDEPLPEEARDQVEGGLAAIDVSSAGESDAVTYVSDELAGTGKRFLVISPARLSCDGVEYFEGFSVVGDFDRALMEGDASLCEMQRTLDDARDLSAVLIERSGVSEAATFEVFEAYVDKASEVYASGDAYVPDESQVVYQGDKEPARDLTVDELQSHAGDMKESDVGQFESDGTEPDVKQ